MNYQAIYNRLIERGKHRTLKGYCERHHITPRCMGGNNDSENLVKLTAREHFIAHRLLTKIYPDNHKLKNAVWRMCNGNNSRRNYGSTSRVYDFVKTERSKRLSLLLKGKPTNRFPSAETRAKMSAKRKGKKRPPEATRGIKNSRLGKPMSEEAKAKLSALNKGKKLSEETKAKMLATKQKKLSKESNRICKFCKTEYQPTSLTNKMCSACRNPKLCKCGCGEMTKTPGRFYKVNHDKSIERTPFCCLRVCEICNNQYVSKSFKGKICSSCAKPTKCKCGCGEVVITPGKYFKHSHDKKNKKKFLKNCIFCNNEFETTGFNGTICWECRKPRTCKCGCGKMVITPGYFYKPNHDKELRASFRYSCVCKFCNKEFLAGSSTGKMCQECPAPRLCKCGCGQIIKLPGKFFRSKRCKLYFEKKNDK